jgi:hypothetical protein
MKKFFKHFFGDKELPKDKLVRNAVEGLVELANMTGVLWNEAYLMYEEQESVSNGTETYRNGRSINYFQFGANKEEAYRIRNKIWAVLSKLFKLILLKEGQLPSACVIRVDKAGKFEVKFSYDNDIKGMSIRLLDMGNASSFYNLELVDIPDFIKEAKQKGL